MLPYLIPVDVLNLYLRNVDGWIPPEHKDKGLICVAVYCACRLLYKIGQTWKNRKKIAVRKKLRAHELGNRFQDSEIEMKQGDLSLTNLAFSDLCSKIQNNSLNHSHILCAFLRRALSVDLYTNAIVELLNPDDFQVIAEKDPQTSQLLLQGIPVSLAEVIHIKGKESTAGLSSFLQMKASKDAVVVQLLKAQGALPILRTNVPQTAYITLGSSNPIFGATVNPVRHGRSPGGTSSGEAVIVSNRGSAIGVGTDISGGLRIPAHFCGVCGLKPTSQRVSCEGVTVVVEGQNIVATCVGPLSWEVEGLVMFMKSVCVPLQHKLDPTVPLMAFSDEIYQSSKPLKIGFIVDDGYTKCVPSVRRTLFSAKAMLLRCGHEVVPFNPPDLLYMLTKLYLPSVYGDHYLTLIRYLAIDKIDGCVRRTFYLYQIMHIIRWLWSWCVNIMNPVSAHVLAVKCPQLVSHWWIHVHQVKVWRHEFISQMKREGLDALLCPVMPFAAVKQGTEIDYTGCLTLCALFNLLDFPAGTVPVSAVTTADLEDLKVTYKPTTRLEKKIKWDQLGKENKPQSSSLNLPVGVQIASYPFQEEMVLRILKDLQKEAAK